MLKQRPHVVALQFYCNINIPNISFAISCFFIPSFCIFDGNRRASRPRPQKKSPWSNLLILLISAPSLSASSPRPLLPPSPPPPRPPLAALILPCGREERHLGLAAPRLRPVRLLGILAGCGGGGGGGGTRFGSVSGGRWVGGPIAS